MTSLALVRDQYLNPWDVGNYYGLVNHGVDLYVCGRGSNVDWEEIIVQFPMVKPVKYNNVWEVLDIQADVIDVPDAHYPFSQYLAKRHDRVVIVGWDNLPGKNLTRPKALKALQDCWKVVARSVQAKHTLVYFDMVPEDKIANISGGIDTIKFNPGEKDRERAVLFVGRPVIQKGLLDLIWAMKVVNDELDQPVELWIAGGDPGSLNGWLEKTDIPTKYLGFLNRDELIEAYQTASVFCVPSLPLPSYNPDEAWLEQMGQVFIEAMACGLPVVSTYSGAIPAILNDAGALVSPRAWFDMAWIIKEMVSNDSFWEYRSNKSRSRALEQFGQDKVARKIKWWYEL